MSQAEAVYAAFQQVFTPICLLAIFLGSLWGIIIGALPGLGSILAITIAIPFTYSLGQAAAIALLLGVYCGSVYGGCISAILINTPGTPASAATCFDGFPMAQQGKAAEALGWATGASVIGGLFSCVVLILCGPRLADFAMQFGPIETFALILMALTCIGSISTGNIVAGLFSGIVGLFIVIIGADPISGDMRFTFGIFRLSAGFDLVSVVVGIFALSEVLSRAAEYITGKPPQVQYTRMRFAPPHEWWRRRVVLLKACVIGSAVGIMPGTGSSTAAFLAYAEAKRSSPNRANMGKGEPDGVIASEASNNAVTGGALVPTLALGLPGDGVTAVMLATLVLHGITPGFRLMTDNPVTVYAAFIALFLANLVMAPQGALVARLFAKLVRIPEPVLMGMVVIMCLLGTYGIRSSAFDLFVTLGMGVFGFIFRAFGMPIAPLVIGMVLGTQFEMSLRQGLLQTRGSFSAFFYGHPIAVGLFILAGIILAGPFAKAGYSKWRMRRKTGNKDAGA